MADEDHEWVVFATSRGPEGGVKIAHLHPGSEPPTPNHHQEAKAQAIGHYRRLYREWPPDGNTTAFVRDEAGAARKTFA